MIEKGALWIFNAIDAEVAFVTGSCRNGHVRERVEGVHAIAYGKVAVVCKVTDIVACFVSQRECNREGRFE